MLKSSLTERVESTSQTMYLDKLIAGDGKCTFAKLTDTIMSNRGADELDDRWIEIANALGTPTAKKNKFRRDLKLDSNISIVIEAILVEWRARQATEATLTKLVQAFRDKGFEEIAKHIEKTFKPFAMDTVDLNNKYKVDRKQTAINAVGKEESLMVEHLQYYMVDLIDKTVLNEDILNKMVDKSLLTREGVECLLKYEKSPFREEEKKTRFYQMIISVIEKNGSLYDDLVVVFQEDSRNRRNGEYPPPQTNALDMD